MAMQTFIIAFNRLKGLIQQYSNVGLGLFKTIRDRLNAHTDARGNVHNLEPADIGLGNVPDWLPATEKQAFDALSNNAFMTPRRTSDFTDENVFKVLGNAFETAADDL